MPVAETKTWHATHYAAAIFMSALFSAGVPLPFGPVVSASYAQADTRETVTITDELGRNVTLKVPIKAVYPDLWYQTEIVRAIGAGETIVAEVARGFTS